MNLKELSDQQYGLLFDVRRSIRYHDLRSGFFDRLHQLTGGLTVLLSGSVIFDLARPGETSAWMLAIATIAALLSAWDIVVGYASKAGLHRDLKARFFALEIAIVSGDTSAETWNRHQVERLSIERDEPPIYRVLDLICHNQLMRAEGFDPQDRKRGANHFAKITPFQRITRHVFHWPDLTLA